MRSPSARSNCVKDDWCAWLPVAKSRVFDAYVEHLETLYVMMSVSLNEAMDLRKDGLRTSANQAINVVAELCLRLTKPLQELLSALEDHAKHFGTIPNTEPLDPENFQGSIGRHSARMSGLLCLVLLSQRAQFLHKTATLCEMVQDLDEEFRATAEELAEGASVESQALWQIVDADHFDLNTCLREAIILLKSFLVALPEDQLNTFQKDFCKRLGIATSFAISNRRHLRHRRMALIAGE